MSMFWGLNMKPGRKYSQTIIKSFHISGVALEKGQEAKLFLAAEQQDYIVATVTKAIPQVALDLNFSKGDSIKFYTTGDAYVSLLGYLHDIDSDDEDENFSLEKLLKGKEGKKSKKSEVDEDESGEEEEDDEDTDDSQIIEEYESFMENGEDEDDDDDEEAEDEESGEEDDSEESEAEEEQPKAKVAKLSPAGSNKKAAKEQNGVAKKEEVKQEQKKEKPEAKKEQAKAKEQAKQEPASGKQRTLSGGVKVVDVLPGKGDEAKPGKKVSVYYIGRLQSNNKTFDSLLKGKPFKFSVGGGEVIKGWDIGVAGMKVGGKRRITCPPHMGYGSRGAPPNIGPNSTLVFDVELKAVH